MTDELKEPLRDWREVPSLQDVVLRHFGLLPQHSERWGEAPKRAAINKEARKV